MVVKRAGGRRQLLAVVAPNAYWLVSENHSAASAAFREPLLCSPANSSNRSRLVHYVPNIDSGNGPISTCSRNYVLLWVPGKLLALARRVLPSFGITLRFLRQDTHSAAPLS
jgi:hypothetical protein